ncbi:MAG TPA: transferase, partial [Kribbellaceae bacterium]
MSETLPDDIVDRLRDCLGGAGYTVDGVSARLGETAHAALGRNETTPAYRATTGGDELDTMIRLFLLQRAVPEARAAKAFPGIVDQLTAAGILVASGNDVRARVDIRPYKDWWVVADLTPGLDGRRELMRPDYVLGVSPASLNLVDLTVPVDVSSALDVGTGCGVQALHLAGHAR